MHHNAFGGRGPRTRWAGGAYSARDPLTGFGERGWGGEGMDKDRRGEVERENGRREGGEGRGGEKEGLCPHNMKIILMPLPSH